MSCEYSLLTTHYSRPKVLANLLVLRKLTRLQFRIHELAVNAYFEAAAIRGYQCQLTKAGLQFGDDLFGQTDRFRFVVSNLTIDDLDIHCYFCSF
jgi:hypothetical protein